MALQKLGQTNFNKYIPFASTSTGDVDFGAASILTCGDISTSGCLNANSIDVGSGVFSVSSGGSVTIDDLTANSIDVSGAFSASSSGITMDNLTANDINANSLDISSGAVRITSSGVSMGDLNAGDITADNIYVSGAFSVSSGRVMMSDLEADSISVSGTFSVSSCGGVSMGDLDADNITADSIDVGCGELSIPSSGGVSISGHQLYLDNGFVKYQ